MTFGYIETKVFREEDHPRDPATGRFTERVFGILRLDPVANGLHILKATKTKPHREERRPNANATRFSGLPEEHRAKMYEQFRKRTPATGTKAKTYPDLVRNIRALWDETPPATRAAGSLWYREAKQAAQAIAAKYDVHEDRAIAVLAALSPQQEWSGNVAFAEYVTRVVTEDRVFDPSPEAIAELLDPPPVRVYRKDPVTGKSPGTWETPKSVDVRPMVGKRLSELDETPDAVGRAINTMMREEKVKADFPGHELRLTSGDDYRLVTASGGFPPIAKAVSILKGADPDEALNGHKVRSFFNNISDPDNLLGHGDVTVDTHATMAALDVLHLPSGVLKVKNRQKAEKEKAAGLLAGSPSNSALNTVGLYAMFASAYRDVADELGVPPVHVQAAVWMHWRDKKGLT